MKALLYGPIACLAVVASSLQPAPQPRSFTYGDRAAVENATREYRDAWLANDPPRVMATLVSDAVLMPSGLAPVSGAEAITRFWFPPGGPATRVTAMELSIDEVRLDGDLAVVSGRGSLTFVTVTNGSPGASRTLVSWYVNVLRRQPDNRWLISRRAWSDVRG